MTDHTFPITGPINLQCRFGHGSLTIHAKDGLTEAKVQVTPRDPESQAVEHVVVAMHGPTLAIYGPRPGGGLFDLGMFGRKHSERDALDIDVTIPTGTALKIATFATDITVHGKVGGADIATGTSTVDLEHIEGDLRLRFGAGPVRLGVVTGSAVVKSGASDIKAGVVGGSIEVAIGSGSLDVGVARESVRLRGGSVQATISTAHADVELTSGSGALTVGLPAGRVARLDVLTGHGELRTDMPIEQSASQRGRAMTIRARTGSGDVTIRRAPSDERLAS
jgi:hypothetical protein